MTSHDVVSVVRGVTGERRVGHAGTLDPAATGLLVVLVGPATRLAPHLTAASKTYEARIVFGWSTDTDDADGSIVSHSAVPGAVLDASVAGDVVAALVGTHAQIPPAYSAIKVAGRTAYKAARAGEALELKTRDIEVSSARLVSVESEAAAWTIRLTVSKGTYVRALARDIGIAMGTLAHLGSLRRTSSGAMTVDRAHRLDAVRATDVRELFVPAVEALGLPLLQVDAVQAAQVRDGRPLEPVHPRYSGPVAITHDGRLLAVYTLKHGLLRPETVLPGGVT